MSVSDYSDDFKRDAVLQITERVYTFTEVSRRFGGSQHSLPHGGRSFQNRLAVVTRMARSVDRSAS